MSTNSARPPTTVRCRTGSLESTVKGGNTDSVVRCRTGSLEIVGVVSVALSTVRCRTGSLEKIRGHTDRVQ